MGILINFLNSTSSLIWGWILILFPEPVFALIALRIVKDERNRFKIFFWLTIVLGVVHICIGASYFVLTRRLLEHSKADYQHGTTWSVSIYDNQSHSGAPIFDGFIYGVQNGLQIDWGFGPPKRDLPLDDFSAVFSTSVDFSPGFYCFVMSVDDGANLLVGDTMLISHYHGYTPLAVFKEPIQLSSDNYPIVIEYYDETNAANIEVFWYELHGDKCESINEP